MKLDKLLSIILGTLSNSNGAIEFLKSLHFILSIVSLKFVDEVSVFVVEKPFLGRFRQVVLLVCLSIGTIFGSRLKPHICYGFQIVISPFMKMHTQIRSRKFSWKQLYNGSWCDEANFAACGSKYGSSVIRLLLMISLCCPAV